MESAIHCNQCHNACRLDEVKCGRGEKYRDYIQNGGKPEDYAPSRGERHDSAEREGRHGHHHGGHGHHSGR